MELTTTSILALFETTKQQRTDFVNDLILKMENGQVDPVKLHLQIKSIEEIVKQATSNGRYKSLLLDEAQKHGKKFTAFNAEFQIKEAGPKYDYSQCNDPVITDLLQQQAQLDEKVKARQEFLQTLPIEGMEVINDETGEAYRIYPPSKSSTTTVSVTLK